MCRVVGRLLVANIACAASNSSRLTSASCMGSGRPDPLGRGVPAHLGDVAEGDVVDVEEHLVLALLVPHLEAGVAGVGEDGAHRGLGPLAVPVRAVTVAGGVVRGGGRDAVAVSPKAMLCKPAPAQNSSKIRCTTGHGDRVRGEATELLAEGGFAGFGWGPASTSW